MKLFFISKWANWQKYRLEILTNLTNTYDYDVEILTTGQLKPYLQSNNKVRYKIFKSIFLQSSKFSFMPGILNYVRKKKPDIVLCLNNSTQFTEYLALFLCKLLKIKFVWWTHGYDHGVSKLPRLIKRIKEKYVIFFLKKGDSIIVFAEKGKKHLLNAGIPSEKIFVAPNTLDTSKLIKQKEELNKNLSYNEIVKDLHLNNDDKVILFSGQLNKHKKVENAILACELLVNKNPEIKLVVIGNGPEYKHLAELGKAKIPNNSIFLGDLFDDIELSKWFTVAQIYVMPGYVGLAIIHAFSFGLPFITEDLSYHSPEIHFLNDGKNGYFAKENDIKDLSDKIEMLISNDELRDSFSKQALTTAQNEGSIENMIDKMNQALSIK